MLTTGAETTLLHPYEYVKLRWDAAEQTLWVYMDSRPRPCFTEPLLRELRGVQKRTEEYNIVAAREGKPRVEYLVVASWYPGIWSLGGDLDLFSACVERQDAERLRTYAYQCIDIGHWNYSGGENRPTVISLVQGDALGGGFEGALSGNFIVAEEQSKLGLPEVLFNLFPGMGAYSFLSRRLDPVRAERFILGGEMHGAEELQRIGVLDEVVPEGHGEQGVVDFIARHRRRANSYGSLLRIRQRWNAIPYEELAGITDEWVEAAMRLTSRDLRLMQRLLRAQGQRVATDEQAVVD